MKPDDIRFTLTCNKRSHQIPATSSACVISQLTLMALLPGPSTALIVSEVTKIELETIASAAARHKKALILVT